MTDHAAVADVLDSAADYIEEHGLARGQGNIGQKRCSIHALDRAAGSTGLYLAACRGLKAAADVDECGLAEWSDASPNDQVVLDAFRLAAKSERILADQVAS
jgi:hypothetical protein